MTGLFCPVTTTSKTALLQQVAQKGCRCLIRGNVQGQDEQGSEHSALVVDVPAYCRGVGADDL